MDLITWNQDYSVGVVEIDEQHKKIIFLINKPYREFSNQTTKTNLKPILDELVSYADAHFATEEQFFVACNYEKSEGHIEMHNQYRKKVEEFLIRYQTEKSEVLFFEVTNFLRDWWTWHINNTDKDYVESFQKHGLK